MVLASTAHVQIVFQLSYTAATVMTRYTGAGCAGEKRGEEKRGSLSLFVLLLQGELPYGFRASFSSGLHGFQTNISL